MDEAAFLDIIRSLKPGSTEIYLHPAVPSGAPISASMRDYRHTDEFAALVSPRVMAALSDPTIKMTGYRELAGLKARQ